MTFFMTHHSPAGAFASLTFGLPGRGVSIDLEKPEVDINSDLLAAVSRGPGRTYALPFVTGAEDTDLESQRVAGAQQEKPDRIEDRWRFYNASELKRTLTAARDSWHAGDLELTVYTPHFELPDPEGGHMEALKLAAAPGLLIDLTIDNTAYDEPAQGFLGLRYLSCGRLRPLDWTSEGKLSGIGLSNQWVLAAQTGAANARTLRYNSVAKALEQGEAIVHMGGREGGILFEVPPRERVTLTAAFSFYREGIVTQGIKSRYYYTTFFEDAEAVCRYVLEQADTIRAACLAEDVRMESMAQGADEAAVYYQAVRGYYGSTQLLIADGKPYYSVGEGVYLWRNTMDLAADHLPYELWRNPWVVRNIMDLYLDRYSYRDKVRFAEDESQHYPGGISFTHDMGNFNAYSPPGRSGYEMPNAVFYHFMTTEELLNGIYLFTGYTLFTEDLDWMNNRKAAARELVISMENRDHYDAYKRDGIMKAETVLCGEHGKEITTYDSLDHALASSKGNLYIAFKTLCAAKLLEQWFIKAGEAEWASRCRQMADRTAKSLSMSYQHDKGFFPANLYQEVPSRLIAAIEPLAIPHFLGVDVLANYPELWNQCRSHVKTCLQPGHGLDGESGGMRLSSTSRNTWTSKVILCIYTMEHVLQVHPKDYPTLMRELLHWCQITASEKTISDQIICDERITIGGHYYPRTITSFLWMNKKG
jgi:hypothetical protein